MPALAGRFTPGLRIGAGQALLVSNRLVGPSYLAAILADKQIVSKRVIMNPWTRA